MNVATEIEGRPKCYCGRWISKDFRRKDGTYRKGLCTTHQKIKYKMYPFEDKQRAPYRKL